MKEYENTPENYKDLKKIIKEYQKAVNDKLGVSEPKIINNTKRYSLNDFIKEYPILTRDFNENDTIKMFMFNAEKRIKKLDEIDGYSYITDVSAGDFSECSRTIFTAIIGGLKGLSIGKNPLKHKRDLELIAEGLVMLSRLINRLKEVGDDQWEEQWYELKTHIEYEGKQYIQRGSVYHPDGTKEISYCLIRNATKFCNEIYCKYCKKTRIPILTSMYQIACSKCGYGLSPDFFTERELVYWLKEGKEIEMTKELKKEWDKVSNIFKKNRSKDIRIKKGKTTFIIHPQEY